MIYWEKQIINKETTIRKALGLMDKLGIVNNDLFVVDEFNHLEGSLSDGDIRRAILNGINLDDTVAAAMHKTPLFAHSKKPEPEIYDQCKKKNIRFVPILDEKRRIIWITDIEQELGLLPVDAVIMAGGKGSRLLPLTEKIPKPLLKVGDKPIIEHNIDRLINHGVGKFYISINHMGDMLKDYLQDGSSKGVTINYIEENKPMGTIGSVKLEKFYSSGVLLIMNSDLLTNINFSDFYNSFIDNRADMAVAVTSYTIDVPYAVLDLTDDNFVLGLREKPKYKYHSNAGIYLIKKELLELIPDDEYFDITDLIEKVILLKKSVFAFPIMGYWLDIGKMEDYKRAQEDIKYLKF